ncbi:hypothetical protein [Cupriavidus sp. UGS-1]|uniref:hypothetical protein n=1 Tax=Cupriavidus sp. UGS-1 TaxID=2899826 RepID=UPI001E5073C9|nr:hypothetical protein [Cupriavidus sp. UGS-1]MCD9124008.1 hypothetical protein [Cupriavidus sp. UGS-1]
MKMRVRKTIYLGARQANKAHAAQLSSGSFGFDMANGPDRTNVHVFKPHAIGPSWVDAAFLDVTQVVERAQLAARFLVGDFSAIKDHRRQQLDELVDEYHRRTDDFDRTICTGPIGPDGERLPANAREMATIMRHANAVLQDVRDRAKLLGFTWKELREELRAYARSS